MPKETVTVTVVPAHPGWHTAELDHGDEDCPLWLEPVIAWEIERTEGPYDHSVGRPGETYVFVAVRPITLEGRKDDGEIYAIRNPSEKYSIPGDTSFESEKDARDYLARKHAQEESRRHARKAIGAHG